MTMSKGGDMLELGFLQWLVTQPESCQISIESIVIDYHIERIDRLSVWALSNMLAWRVSIGSIGLGNCNFLNQEFYDSLIKGLC